MSSASGAAWAFRCRVDARRSFRLLLRSPSCWSCWELDSSWAGRPWRERGHVQVPPHRHSLQSQTRWKGQKGVCPEVAPCGASATGRGSNILTTRAVAGWAPPTFVAVTRPGGPGGRRCPADSSTVAEGTGAAGGDSSRCSGSLTPACSWRMVLCAEVTVRVRLQPSIYAAFGSQEGHHPGSSCTRLVGMSQARPLTVLQG